MGFIKYILLSLCLHLLVFFAISYTPSKVKKEKPNTQHKVQVELKEQVKKKKPEKQDEKVGNIIPKTSSKGNKECKNSFEGIGVYTSHYFGTNSIEITGVVKGYPAHKAGLQKGDYVIDISDGSLRGKAGTVVVLEIYRNFKRFTVSLIREEICRN